MGDLRTNAAAAMLGVSASTLRTWERRFGFPVPRRTAGGHRQYELAEIEALRSAFAETHNISSAVSLARERGAGPVTPSRLRAAFGRFDEDEADRVLEESLAVRSLERTVDEVLLAAVEALAAEEGGGTASADYAFAWRWATCWLSAARRTAPTPSRAEAVVVFDATRAGEVDALHVQALELVLRRGGLRTLTLAVGLDPTRLGRALHAVAPSAVVLAGRGAELDALGRLVFAARRAVGDRVEVLDFRGALPDTGAGTVVRLGDRPLRARERLLAVLEGDEPVARPLPHVARGRLHAVGA